MSDVRKTPLHAEHLRLEARMVEFAGWHLPIQYRGVKEEHLNVRSHVGLFDVSHMGEIFVRGPEALATLQWITSNDVSKLEEGQAQYSLFPNAEGGIVDDLIVYCLKKNQEYLLCVNAANIAKDLSFVQTHNRGAEISDESDQWAQIAVQGPKSVELCQRLFGSGVADIPYFQFRPQAWQGADLLLARTGYTGEDGFEVFVPNAVAAPLWRELLAQGENLGVQAIGLGARDTLRTEMKYALYGHEIDDQTNPYAAGLGWVVKPKAKDFLGKDTILAAKERGLSHKLIAFKALERGIPREGYLLKSFDNMEIGRVTSGTLSPTLNAGIGIGYVAKEHAAEGSEIAVDIRGRLVKAQVVKAALVKSSS